MKTQSVAILALPEAVLSTITGIHDVLHAPRLMGLVKAGAAQPFEVEIVGTETGPLQLASGMPVDIRKTVDAGQEYDLVIVPSFLLPSSGWRPGRYPQLVHWLRTMHTKGAVLCSACSGVFLLGETGVLDERDVTVHFSYTQFFEDNFPSINVHPERALIVSGDRDELISCGASTSWHDLVLYLLARYAGAGMAGEVARLFALQRHQEGLAPFMIFQGRTDHGDGEILSAQHWLAANFSVANPVEEMEKRSRLASRTFKRRFVLATGLSPLVYVQRLRIEEAKRRLENSAVPVDEISWNAGYEDAAFFRRLFKRTTGLSPAAYRKKFRYPLSPEAVSAVLT